MHELFHLHFILLSVYIRIAIRLFCNCMSGNWLLVQLNWHLLAIATFHSLPV